MRGEMNVHQLDCKLSLHDTPFFSGCLNSIPSFTIYVKRFQGRRTRNPQKLTMHHDRSLRRSATSTPHNPE